MNHGRTLDRQLIFGALLMSLLGCGVILTAGFARSIASGDGFLSRELIIQFIALLLAVPTMIGIARVPASVWRRLMPVVFFIAFLGLLAVKLFGHEMSGAQRWIKLGPITIQPAEFMKVAAILFVAVILSTRKEWKMPKLGRNPDWAKKLDHLYLPKLMRFWPALLLLGVIYMIEREPDLGTAAVVGAVTYLMFCFGGATRFSIVFVTLLAVVGTWMMVKSEPYRMERITSHLHRWEDHHVDDIGYQTTQSETAMASGGFAGVGVGAGRAKHMMPAATTDFAMATVAEETGFLGVVFVLAATGFIIWRLLEMAKLSSTLYGYHLCIGVAIWLTVQACVNLAMANGFLPPIGIPFPFISSGGSSLFALWIALGLCQSAYCEQPALEGSHEARRHRWGHRRTRLSGA